MQQEITSKLWNLVMIILSPVFVLCIVYTTCSDKVLSKYTSLILLASTGFIIICCLCNLSAIIFVKRKDSARPVPDEMLSDSELESDYESANITPIQNWRLRQLSTLVYNLYAFGKLYLPYGIILGLAFLNLLSALICSVLTVNIVDDNKLLDDLCQCAVQFSIPGVVLLLMVFLIANVKEAYAENTDCMDYIPFEEVIHYPMRVIAGKTFAAYLTGGTRFFVELFSGFGLVLYSIYALSCLLQMERSDIKSWQECFKIESIHPIFVGITALTIFVGSSMMTRVMKEAYKRAKQSLLITMEQNWQRNLLACEYLLPDENMKSLEGLQDALFTKLKTTLSTEEKYAFEYISLPLWKPKKPFVLRRE